MSTARNSGPQQRRRGRSSHPQLGKRAKGFRAIGQVAYALALMVLLLRFVDHSEKAHAAESQSIHRKTTLSDTTNSPALGHKIQVVPEPSTFAIVSMFAVGMRILRKRPAAERQNDQPSKIAVAAA